MAEAMPAQASASLYLHVPFCRSMCWYCGCHTTVARRDEPIAVYKSALRCEIDLVVAAARPPHAGRAHPFRRRHADHHGTGIFRRPDRADPRIASSSRLTAEIAVEIDPRTLSRTR